MTRRVTASTVEANGSLVPKKMESMLTETETGLAAETAPTRTEEIGERETETVIEPIVARMVIGGIAKMIGPEAGTTGAATSTPGAG